MTEDKTPAQERAEIGTPAGEDAEKGRNRHGTKPLTREAAEFAYHEEDALKANLEADQTAELEEAGEKVRGFVTEDDLAEEEAFRYY
ncbi:MAG: hypothetical protein Q7N50_12120 [Armatimonadota bacterium]|nr:hypothetical protein [Armatimonadota bacterium]